MKANKDWNYRTSTVLVEYKAGDELHDFAVADAIAAGVTEKGKEDGNGPAKTGAKGNPISLKG